MNSIQNRNSVQCHSGYRSQPIPHRERLLKLGLSLFGEHSYTEISIDLIAEHGVTFVFSTHDPRVMKYARRLVGVVDGRVNTDERKGPGD